MVEPEPRRAEPRREVAARNVEAVLDAAERLLRAGRPLTFSALSEEAGVSRPTVYAHFPGRQAVLAALVERAVGEELTAIEEADPDAGPAAEALKRLVTSGWQHLARHLDIVRAAHAEPGAIPAHGQHEEVLRVIGTLIRRGQREGAFRRDLPADWLASSCLALVHNAARAVNEGTIDPGRVGAVLGTTVADLCAGPRRSP
jgi:AcrR family transcriptional regulator